MKSDVTANKRFAVVAKLNTAYTCVANVYGRHCAETVCGFSTTGSTAITVNGSTTLEAHSCVVQICLQPVLKVCPQK